MVGAEFDGSAVDGAGFAADDGVEVFAVGVDGAEEGVAGAGFYGGGPGDVFVVGWVLGLVLGYYWWV